VCRLPIQHPPAPLDRGAYYEPYFLDSPKELSYGDNIKFDKKLDWNFCPKSNCNGNTIEIDELFIPIIIELNKKGYKTTYSCSGHIYDSHINSYIGFEGDIKLNSLPNGYVYDKIGISCIRKVFDNSKENLDEIFLWIDENLAKDYSNEELAKAYYHLSKADIFRKRIIKQQYWRFLYYQNLLMSFGIALSKDYPSSKFTNYTRTQRLLKIWINNRKNIKRKEFINNLSPELHLSNKKLAKELQYMTFLKY